MKIDFSKASFKDFENIEGQDIYETARGFQEYLDFLKANGHLNYRIESLTHVGPEMNLVLPGESTRRGVFAWSQMITSALVSIQKLRMQLAGAPNYSVPVPEHRLL